MLSMAPRSLQQLDLPEAEAFRMLRARLMYFNVARARHRIVVTSPGQGDGKTTVAWYLAAAAAESGLNVLVLEADLRRPTLAELKGLREQPGLAEYLTGGAPLDEVTRTIVVRNPPSGDDQASVDVIVAGLVPPNPIELLESQQMVDLLAVLSERYDLVVVDTPPAVIVSDALPLMRQADGIVAVTRIGVTQRRALHQLARQLRELHAPALGTVVNGTPASQSPGYGYGYAYRTQRESYDPREGAPV
jgi:receptor protein-tyrosine kinase